MTTIIAFACLALFIGAQMLIIAAAQYRDPAWQERQGK